MTLLLLSGNAKLAGLAYQYAFASNRLALAATQTSLSNCITSATGGGQLAQAAKVIWDFSGPLYMKDGGSFIQGETQFQPGSGA